jgi:hypothetical protein
LPSQGSALIGSERDASDKGSALADRRLLSLPKNPERRRFACQTSPDDLTFPFDMSIDRTRNLNFR